MIEDNFLDFLDYVLSHNLEMSFTLNDNEYILNYADDKIMIYENKAGTPEYFYCSGADLLEHFMLDGKPLKEQIDEISHFSEI